MCFGDYQKLTDNEDWIDNLLEHLHHQNINFLVLEREILPLRAISFIRLQLVYSHNCN